MFVCVTAVETERMGQFKSKFAHKFFGAKPFFSVE